MITELNQTQWIIYSLVVLVLSILTIAAYWRMFNKAGVSGWKSIVPFYNAYLMFQIAGHNGWWFLAAVVPLLNIYAAIILALGIAKNFGKGIAYAIFGLIIFGPIGYWIIGFGDSKYEKPSKNIEG